MMRVPKELGVIADVIRGADDSTVFIDIQQTPNVPQLQGGTKQKEPS